MLRTGTKLLFAFIILLTIGVPDAAAQNPATNDEINTVLKKAQQAQFSLGEKHRTLEEIKEVLNPYFSQDYQEQFLEAHLYKEDKGYITYGTDVNYFYIPFFSYDESTKFFEIKETETIIVYEYFEVDESMPYLNKNHYEFIEIDETKEGIRIVNFGNQEEKPDFLVNDSINTVAEPSIPSQDVIVESGRAVELEKRESLNMLEELKKSSIKYSSFKQLTKPFALHVFNRQNASYTHSNPLPMFAAHFFQQRMDKNLLARR
ncbi:DUF3993 domain-containing protein [Sutcliffiella deserti]|uniref:DUF3993 domain-containing protein n=1 Tax=Sutcliffiella deserti TaxID=2875501 RepID=UPI001CBD3239|nr:DUF3993 domain-containing protein [Sutcliffiella deserti]